MTVKDIRKRVDLTQKEFSDIYKIPLSTLQHWEQNVMSCPDYVVRLLNFTVMFDDVLYKFTTNNPDSFDIMQMFVKELDKATAENK